MPLCLSSLHHAAAWNDIEGLERLFADFRGQIAALTIAADYATMAAGESFYPAARELSDRDGVVLIYDEIVTGFRIAIGGAQEYFGVTPDLAVFAKGVANGMPLSVYCGRRELMSKFDKVVVSSTVGGESLSLAAAKAAIETYRNEHVVGHIWGQAERLWTGVNGLFARHGIPAQWKGFWPCPSLTFAAGGPGRPRGELLAGGLSERPVAVRGLLCQLQPQGRRH